MKRLLMLLGLAIFTGLLMTGCGKEKPVAAKPPDNDVMKIPAGLPGSKQKLAPKQKAMPKNYYSRR
jgi:hypothetical protein